LTATSTALEAFWRRQGVARLPRKAARELRGWAARVSWRRRPRGLILLYHRIARPTIDPWKLCVSPENFAEHVAVLHRYARVVPLTDLQEAVLATPSGRPPVAITFDDGYVDNLQIAEPILAQAGAPATVFLATGSLGRDQPFWWDRLAWIVLAPVQVPEELELELPDVVVRWRDSRDGGRQRLHRALWTALRRVDEEARDATLDRLALWSGSDADPLGAGRPLTPVEVRELEATGTVTLGGHTVTHPPLPQLSLEQRRWEIVESLEACARITGRRPTTFSYPHGDTDPATIEVAREAGVEVACAGHEALVGADSDHCALPRVGVHNWSGNLFSRWLRWYWLP
jgi:peptidoglycan/xylan/chitin deacetylase (PgdA/CDA1 family)